MSKEHMDKLKKKIENPRNKEKECVLLGRIQQCFQAQQDVTRKAKALLELNLANDLKDNKKGF